MGEKGRDGRRLQSDAPVQSTEEVAHETEGEIGREPEFIEIPEGGEVGRQPNV